MQTNEYDWCSSQNVTYSHRVYDPQLLSYCTVPDSGYDTLLFASIGILITCLSPRKHYAIILLLAGILLQVLNMEVNLYAFSNSINLWLDISPMDIFLYAFLPPLLLDSAIRIDFFIFKKVMYPVLIFAFLIVACNTIILASFMLFGLRLDKNGWSWNDAFLFSTIVTSTDAVAVSAIMKGGGGAEELIALIEGESLFNDATSFVFFELFWRRFKEAVEGTILDQGIAEILMEICGEVLWLATGGFIIGLAFGIITRYLLRWLHPHRCHKPAVDVALTVGMAYLCFYIANAPLKLSGVIAVVVFGLYGSATSRWDMSPETRLSGVFEKFWDVTQLLINGVVFFYAGVSSANFFYRTGSYLLKSKQFIMLLTLPIIYIAIFAFRFVEIAIFSPILALVGNPLKWNEIGFITVAGLRGADMALILVQILLQYEFPSDDSLDLMQQKRVRSEIAYWTCGFVMLTLLINGPLLPTFLKLFKLNEVSKVRMKLRERAREDLLKYTHEVVSSFKADGNEIMRGVNWNTVREFLDLNDILTLSRTFSIPLEKTYLFSDSQNILKSIVSVDWKLLKNLIKSTNSEEEKQRFISRNYSIEISGGSEILKDEIISSYQNDDIPFSVNFSKKDFYDIFTPKQNSKRNTESIFPREDKKRFYSNPRPQSFDTAINTGASSSSQYQPPKNNDVYQNLSRMSAPPIQSSVKKVNSCLNLYRHSTSAAKVWEDLSLNTDNETSPFVMLSMNKMLDLKRMSYNNLTKEPETLALLYMDSEINNSKEELLAEARIRMLNGFQKYFNEKRTAGFLSGQGLRLLQWACDISSRKPEQKLDIWNLLLAQISGSWKLKIASPIRYWTRIVTMNIRTWPKLYQSFFLQIFYKLQLWLDKHLTKSTHLCLEVANEYWLALLVYQSHATWLLDAENASILSSEVQDQAEQVWNFLIDREIEAPERFEYIQTFRAIKAILKLQAAFINNFGDWGTLDEFEHDLLREEIDKKMLQLDRFGPPSKQLTIVEFLRNLPFFVNVSEDVFQEIISNIRLHLFKDGELIVKGGDAYMDTSGIHIIINGLVKSNFYDSYGCHHEFYLGKGGILGLVCSISNTPFPKIGKIFAQLNALGHGPSIITIPSDTLRVIHTKAASGSIEHQKFELLLFRLASLHVVEYMQNETMDILIKYFEEQESSYIIEEKKIAKDLKKTVTIIESNDENINHLDLPNLKIKKLLTIDAIENDYRKGISNPQENIESIKDNIVVQGLLSKNLQISSMGKLKTPKSQNNDEFFEKCQNLASAALEDIRIGLAEGDILLLPPNSKLPNIEFFCVMLHGAVTSSKEVFFISSPFFLSTFRRKTKTKYQIEAPVVFPWGFRINIDNCDVRDSSLFQDCVTGGDGCILVCSSRNLDKPRYNK